MKTPSTLKQSALIPHSFTVAAAALFASHSALALDGTWTQISGGTASGTWSTAATGNWADGIVADGSGFTADFSTLDVSGATNSTITLSGGRTIGNLIFGDTNTATANVWVLSGSSTLTLAGTTPTITHNATGETSRVAVNVVLAGSSGLTKAGDGIVSLGSANTYTGGTTISAGRLRARNNTALGDATSGAVTVASGAGLELDNSISVANTINLNGSSALTNITGNNILSGTVNLQSASQINMTGSSGTLNLSGSLNMGSNQLTVDGPRQLTVSGPISGTGILHLKTGGFTTVITNNNSGYSGQIKVERTTLALGHNGAAGTGNILLGVDDQASGIRSTDTTTRTLANSLSLTGSTNSTYHFGSTTGSVNGDLTFTDTTDIALGGTSKKLVVYNRTEFSAGFTGTTGLTMQTGTGTLVLNGTSTYSGATTVNAGTLLVNGSLGSASAVAINSGGTLGGTGTVGATTVASGGTLAPGNSIGTLNFGQLTLGGISNFEIDPTLGLGLNADLANVTGSVTYGGTLNVIYGGSSSNFTNGMLFNLFDAGSFSGSFDTLNLPALTGGLTWQNDLATNGTISVIPEPNVALLAGSLGMLCLLRRNAATRRRN